MQSRPRMTRGAFLIALAVAAAAVCSSIASAEARDLEVEVWTNHGDEAVVFAGDPVDIYLRTNRGASVIVYAVDTDGWVHILFPSRSWEDGRIRGDRTYRICGSRVDGLFDDFEGLVVIGAVATRKRLPVARWLEREMMLVFRDQHTWVVSEAPPCRAVIGRVVGDPFEAVWAIEDALLPGGGRGAVAADFCWFSVETVCPRPTCIVIDGRPRWRCHPRFHLVFDFGVCLDWPRAVVRTCVHRMHRKPSCPAPGAGGVRSVGDRVRWKEKNEKNSQKEWNQEDNPCVLVSSRSKTKSGVLLGGKKNGAGVKPEGVRDRFESRKRESKPSPASNKSASRGYSSRKGHEGSSKKGAAPADHAGRHKQK